MTALLDALEALAETTSVKNATICLRLAADQDVDRMYLELGPAVDENGRRIADKSVPPEWDETQQGIRWRTATVDVAGVRVILNGPMQVGARKEAA